MFTGNDIVVMKTDNGPVVAEYQKHYLSVATEQPSETFKKTFDGKELPNVCTRPKGERVAVDPALLMEAAIAYFAVEYPGTEKAPNDPIVTLLEAAEYGADLWKRNKIQSDMRPSKPIDKATAISRLVKNLMAANPKLTVERATAKATALLEDDSE